MSLNFFSADLSIKTVNLSQRIISGYAASHNNIDRVRDIIDPSASVKAVRRLKAPSDVGVFVGHDTARLPIGIPQRIEATPRGLYTETYILKGHDGDNLLAVAKDLHDHGLPLGMSIGYRTEDSRHERAANKMVRRIMDYSLKEYSYASHHVIANPDAVTTDVKSKRRKALSEGSDPAGGMLVPADRKGGSMQYRVEQRGSKWAVICDADADGDADDGEVVGTYGDEATANAVALALRKEAGGAGDEEDEDTEDNSAGKTAGVKALWSTAMQNKLPDSSFLYIEDGGTKDEGGRTVPRSKRHFPVRDAQGNVDLAHVRNAIARIPQSNAPGLDDAKKAALQARARRMLETADDGKTYTEPDEWQTGSPIAIRAVGYRLLDLSDRIAEELKALVLLGEETKSYTRVRPALRDDLRLVAHEFKGILDWIETVARGEDELATVNRYRYEMMAALDL